MLLPESLVEHSAVWHGLYGTLFTWFVTALGASVVFLVPDGLAEETEGKILDCGLGAAAGIMLAASYWSLLAPAIEEAEEAEWGPLAFLPAAVGFLLGATFVFLADVWLPDDAEDPSSYLEALRDSDDEEETDGSDSDGDGDGDNEGAPGPRTRGYNLRQRKGGSSRAVSDSSSKPRGSSSNSSSSNSTQKLGKRAPERVAPSSAEKKRSWRRLIMLVVAVTLHNFPEGLAVGVAFGAVGSSAKATLTAAEGLAFGIGIQNFPEGLAISLPMRRLGYSRWRCFFYGQLSGMVEPIGGVLGAAAVQLAKPVLPYALSFAAGAMVYVVVDSLVPEAHSRGNSRIASWGAMIGFVVMMTLDVALA